MTLHGGRAVVTGRRSEASLYDFGLATYDELLVRSETGIGSEGGPEPGRTGRFRRTEQPVEVR